MRLQNALGCRKHDSNGLCAACCRSLAEKDIFFFGPLADLIFLALELPRLLFEQCFTAFRRPRSSVEPRLRSLHYYRVGSTACEECLARLVRPGNRRWEDLKEWFVLIARGMTLGFQLLGASVFGVAMIFVSIFPSSVSAQTPEQLAAAARADEDKKRKEIASSEAADASWKGARSAFYDGEERANADFQNARNKRFSDSEASLRAWDKAQEQFESERDAHTEKEREKTQKFWKEYNERIDAINDLGKVPAWDVHKDIAHDDRLVRELNSTAKAVADGKEDPRKLEAVQEALYKSRQEKHEKDAKRDMLHGQFLDKVAQARACYERAAVALRHRDFEAYEKLAGEGEAVWTQAEFLMAALRNV